MKVGFIGLGVMGAPMAANFLGKSGPGTLVQRYAADSDTRRIDLSDRTFCGTNGER